MKTIVVILMLAAACGAPVVAAEVAYENEQWKRCVEPLPILGPTAPKAEREAAWAAFDACRANVRDRWGIVVTDTAKDGGR